MKKFFVILMMVTILVTSTSFAAFSDLPDGHWAKGVVEEMVKAGIISGYTDGTFRPSKEISKIESLILLSRVAGLNNYPTEAEKYLTTYTSTLSKYTTQYKKDVAYLLGTGVLKESDLDNLLSTDKINSSLTREEMAILVTKVLGKEAEATKNSIVVLPFTDTSSISANAKPYVYYVYSQGIIVGMADGSFSPKTALTRAQAASILQRIYKKVDIKPSTSVVTPTPTPTTTKTSSATSFVTGTITKIDTSASSVWIKSSNNTEEYEYDSNTKFYVSSKEVTSSSMKVNATVTATITDDAYITSMNISDGAKVVTTTVKGTIYAASSTAKTITVTSNGSRTAYTYDNSTTYTLDGKTSTLTAAIKKNYEVTLTVDSSKYITKAAVVSPDERIIGEITAVSTKYGYVVFEDEDDEEYILADDKIDNYSKSYNKSSEDYYFDDDTDFKYNGSTKKYSAIATSSYLYKKGNYIAITLGKNDYIDLIEVATKKATLTDDDDDDDDSDDDMVGKITVVNKSTGYIVIEDVNKGKEYILMDDVVNKYDEDYEDEEEDYYFNKNTKYSYEGTSKTYSAIATTSYLYKKGNYVGLTLKNDHIEELKVASKESKLSSSSSSSSSKSTYSSDDMMDDNYLVGEITDIDDDCITIECDDGEEYDIDVLANAIVLEYDTKKPSTGYIDYDDAYDDDDIGKGDRVMVLLYDDDETTIIILLD